MRSVDAAVGTKGGPNPRLARLVLDAGRWIGRDLERPECVVCGRDGTVYASDRRGGVTAIAPDGTQSLHARPGLLVNGFALEPDGAFLVANLGVEGGVWRVRRDGTAEPVLMEVDGVALPGANFVLRDAAGRTWISISARRHGGEFRADVADGFLVLLDARGARIVADGLSWTNECRLDASGRHLYVVETFARTLTRFAIGPDGSLSARTAFTRFGHGTYPDGLALDVEGGIWVSSVVSNRLIRVTPDGAQQLLLEDADPERVDALERLFLAGRLTRERVLDDPHSTLGNLSSIAFGGPDLRTIHLGSLCRRSLATFRVAVAGLAPAHWSWT